MAKKEIPTQEAQKKIQEKLLMYQLLQNNVEALAQQMSMAEKTISEIDMSRQTISDFSSLKQDTGILVPLGNNFYGYGKAEGKEKVLLVIGAGIVIPKTAKESMEFLNSRMSEVESIKDNLEQEIKNSMDKINEISPELQKALQ